MKLLVITGLRPSKEKPGGGIFITKRLQVLHSMGIEYSIRDIRTYYDPLRRFFISAGKRAVGLKAPVRGYTEASSRYIAEGINYDGLPVLAGCRRIASEKAIIRDIAEIAIGGGFDILHAHPAYPEGYLTVKAGELCNLPVIVTSHGGEVQTLAKQSPKIRMRLLETYNRASAAIFVSNALLDDAKRYGYSGKNAFVIPNGYDASLFRPFDRVLARKTKDISPNTKVIGFIGGFVPSKRVDQFQKIFAKIIKMEPDVCFVLIGDGPLAPKLRDDTGEMKIIMPGYLPQVAIPPWLATFDILMLPSRSEGWGCVIKEAQAMGIACIGTSVGGIPEAIGSGGLVVPDGFDFLDVFAKKVVQMLNNPFDSIDVIACSSGFSWDETVKLEFNLYKSVLDAHRLKIV